MIIVRKKEGEQPSALIVRFTKRVKRSGILKEANKRRFTGRQPNKRARRATAIHRSTKQVELEKARKSGNA